VSAPKRIQLRRTKGWRKPEGAVVVARPSKWGNPYRIDEYRAYYPDAEVPELRRLVVSDFRGLLEGRWTLDDGGIDGEYPSFDAIRTELAGRDLACWCPAEQACHADVLLELANRGCVCEPGNEWHHPITGHCADCGCFTCSGER
jgi:hypothetical protein